MNRILLLFSFLFMFVDIVNADEVTIPNNTYRIVCASSPTGSLVLGAEHNKSPLLYYSQFYDASAEDAWWTVTHSEEGYTFCNAYSNEYIYYDSNREQHVAKGLRLSEQTTSYAYWDIKNTKDGFVITNKSRQDQSFDLRVGEGLLGTYNTHGGENQTFILIDKEGNRLGGGKQPDPTPEPQGEFFNYVDSIRFDGKDLVYCTDWNMMMFNVRPKYMDGRSYAPRVEVRFKPSAQNCRLLIDDYQLKDGAFVFDHISGTDEHTLSIVKGDEEMVRLPLQFTFLPIVQLNVDRMYGKNYVPATVRVNYFQHDGYDSTYHAKLRYRGASSYYRDKKGMALKLVNAKGESIDREFLGLRNDNNWIFDAGATEPSGVRNRIATDIWNKMSRKPYYAKYEKKEVRLGTRGKMVEVIMNGKYRGVYSMTEKMDRKQMRLKKFKERNIRGLLYKGKGWSYEVFFGHDQGDVNCKFPSREPRSADYANENQSESWCSFDVKYPDAEDGEPISWTPLRDNINFTATATDDEFVNDVWNHFDHDTWTDYFLFLDLILATDNHGKNLYYGFYNITDKENGLKMVPGVWDLDGTLGARWDGSTYLTQPDVNYMDFIKQHEHGAFSLYERMFQNDERLNWSETLGKRYEVLRNTILTNDKLHELIGQFEQRLAQSGADKREEKRWDSYHKDIAGSLSYIQDWVSYRLDFLDEQYGYDRWESKSLNIEIGKEKFATLYNDVAMEIPDGVIARTMHFDGSNILLGDTYAQGDILPAKEGVIISAAPGKYRFQAVDEDIECDADNRLRGTLMDAKIKGDGKFYKFESDENKLLGFYWQKSGGKAFVNKANEAYLCLPEDADVASSYVLNDIINGIEDIIMLPKDTVIYDLKGRRVKAGKGVYIINGKKVLN